MLKRYKFSVVKKILLKKKLFKIISIIEKCIVPFTWFLFKVNILFKKRYCGNEGLGFAWDHIKVCKVGLFITTGLKFVIYLWILLFLNKRSVVHFCRWRRLATGHGRS